MQRLHNGFTLLELLMVVAIIGILSAIAVPQYTDYVRRGKVVEAHAMLSDHRVKMEQFYQDNRSYANSGACGAALPTGQYFTYSCTVAADGQTYTSTATSKANVGLLNSGDYTFTVNDANAKATTKFAGSSVTATCWLLKKGQSC